MYFFYYLSHFVFLVCVVVPFGWQSRVDFFVVDPKVITFTCGIYLEIYLEFFYKFKIV